MTIDELYRKYQVPTQNYTSLEVVQDFKNLIHDGRIIFLQGSEPFLIPNTYVKGRVIEVDEYYLFEVNGYIYDKLTLKDPISKELYMERLKELNEITGCMPQVVVK